MGEGSQSGTTPIVEEHPVIARQRAPRRSSNRVEAKRRELAVGRAGVPFRWNVANPLLWRRIGGERAPAAPEELALEERILDSAAAILRAAGDGEVVFVGRSLENVHDFLLGALARTSWRDRVRLLQLSIRDRDPDYLGREFPGALDCLRRYFEALDLLPQRIASRERPVAFVDLVNSGDTYGSLTALLRHWGGYDGRLWRRVNERVRWICVVERGHPRQQGWRPDHSWWNTYFEPWQFRSLAIDWHLWRYWGEEQEKTTDAYWPGAWGRKSARRPSRDPERLLAARRARSLYRLGERWRRRLAHELERPVAPAEWLEGLAAELRG